MKRCESTIGVIGKNEQHPNDVVAAATMHAAEAIGRLVAERGGVIVTGGRAGVMEAASRGAQMAGGLTIGFLPGMDKAGANPFVDIVFPTGLGRARNLLTARCCDALIMVGGSTGTLNELTIAYAEARPVVILRGSGGWADRIEGVLHQGKYLDEREDDRDRLRRHPRGSRRPRLRTGHRHDTHRHRGPALS